MFYAHYDGQPVDPAQWATPPWTPVLRDKTLTEGGREIAAPTTPGAVDGEWRLYWAVRRRRQGADHRDAGRARCASRRLHAALG